MISRMLSKPGEKAHFAKIMVIRWVFVKILSRDAVPSTDFTIVYCKKKGFKIFFAPKLARSAVEVCSEKQKTAFLSKFGSLLDPK